MNENASQLLIRRTQLQNQIEEASRELEKVNKVLGFSDVEFVEHVEGTNCAEWLCKRCRNVWISPNKWPCPKCYLLEPVVPTPKKKRILRVDRNERGKFELWAPEGCKNGHAAGLGSYDTLQAAIDEAIRREGPPKTIRRAQTTAELTYGD